MRPHIKKQCADKEDVKKYTIAYIIMFQASAHVPLRGPEVIVRLLCVTFCPVVKEAELV